MRKIYLLILMMILIPPVMGGDNQSTNNTTYRVLVDNTYGFYRVYAVNNIASVSYENRTLNISKGDTIIWINDAVPDVKLTIISKENLWGKYDGELKWNYKQFIHTFNKSGIYDIYISEYSNFQQKIIVGPIETINNNTVNTTNITKSNLTLNNSNERKINVSTTNNSTVPVDVPLEKKPGTEVVALITVTSLLVYIFERKIK